MFRFISAIGLAALLVSQFASAAGEVNIYSYRKPQLVKPMFDQFSEKTGIKVNAVFAKKGMLQRVKSEGRNSPADLIFTTDIGRLSDFKNAELTQTVESAEIIKHVPANLRDPENHWFGLTSRARVLVVSKDRVSENEISNYEDLADPAWRGRICSRSGKHPYNIGLIAMMMAAHGNEEAERWLTAVKSNLARRPEGNDRAQVKAISEGVCDVAVINHYYLAKMQGNPEQQPWLDSIDVIFPNQSNRGAHMNISGMAMAKYAPNPENARKLMEFLAGDTAQEMYAEVNGEYPVNPAIPLQGFLKELGGFTRDSLDLDTIAANRAEASKMVDRVAFDN